MLEPTSANMDDEMMIWAKVQINELLDEVSSAWDVVQSDSKMEMKLKQIKNPLEMFGSKYCKISTNKNLEDSNIGDENLHNLEVEEKQVDKKDNMESGTNQNVSLVAESLTKNEKDFEKFKYTAVELDAETSNMTEEDLQKWKNLNENPSTPTSTIHLQNEDVHSPDQNQKEKTEKLKLKSTDTGYMKVQELKTLVETYTKKPITLKMDDLLSLLDRDEDGWILYEEFEASLSSGLLTSE